jgi:hypothetical protein
MERPKSVPGVPRGGSENEVAKKTLHPWKEPSKWLQNGTSNRKVCGIVDDIFQYFPESFLG